RVTEKNWRSAAIVSANLSELLLSRGELREALELARNSVELADKSGDVFQPMCRRTSLAAAQFAMSLREQAAAQFDEAERMQKEIQPGRPLLYSQRGFFYCDFLLDQGRDAEVRERTAQTLRIAERNGWLLDIAFDHLSLGRAYLLAFQRGVA